LTFRISRGKVSYYEFGRTLEEKADYILNHYDYR
jgi:hypothetical protein